MEISFSKNILVGIGVLILLLAIYLGAKTYYYLKKYIDIMLLLKNVDVDAKIEEYSIRMSEAQSQLIPWGLAYMLNIVLFTIIIYVWLK